MKPLDVEMPGLRGEILSVKRELLKWSFLSWIGQVAVMAGLISFMLRGVAP